MRLLLDTHVWIWMSTEPERLSRKARVLVEDPKTELWLSAAVTWEISIKHALGRLTLEGSIDKVLHDWMGRTSVVALPISHAHGIEAGQLPRHHTDPFDRMLIAQSRHERIPILTADSAFGSYECETMKA